MTGIAEIYLCIKNPYSKDARTRLRNLFNFQRTAHTQTRFVVLSWKRTGSNLLCGILHHHPEIVMHNELFNQIDIFTYYPKSLIRNEQGDTWTTLGRDLFPDAFLEHFWGGKQFGGSGPLIKEGSKAVGFKSFPDHWADVRNENIWQKAVMDDIRVKKIILQREDELAVFVSMMRAEKTGRYMTIRYPKDLKLRIEPARFQAFVNNYRDTFRRRYKSIFEKQDTFRVSYEQLVKEEEFEFSVLPLLWEFLGVDKTVTPRKLHETVKQADPCEDLSTVIENYAELEFCFRHTDVLHFSRRRNNVISAENGSPRREMFSEERTGNTQEEGETSLSSWSILLPICSRVRTSEARPRVIENASDVFNSNRLIDITTSSQHQADDPIDQQRCWDMLYNFAKSLRDTASPEQLQRTECVVGVDVDDTIFHSEYAFEHIRSILLPCKVVFVDIQKVMYGKVCKIWSKLGDNAKNDFMILLGDDIELLNKDWQLHVVKEFHEISRRSGLPFGAACVALRDHSFPGFPTFPVVHRWHVKKFGAILPRQFVNQGGDPYLFELYSRFNASSFVSSGLRNTIGGDADARYKKHEINWRGQILKLNLIHLEEHLSGRKPKAICLDVVVPSYRINNKEILQRIVSLRASVPAYVRFWLVLDNPEKEHIAEVTEMADALNRSRFLEDKNNYYINVVHYGENRGASFARNYGYNYSTGDWALFLDDDVIPDSSILDAYIGAIRRYPDARVFVGNTELPPTCSIWTEMLQTCNIMFFYGISKHATNPAWGVTANLLVRGSRHNSTIQFKLLYPKTGGGEDIDFVFQFKDWYGPPAAARHNVAGSSFASNRVVVGVPGARASHPWWGGGKITCYKQINGWAWGDSLCINEWPNKTYWVFPNWIEFLSLLVVPCVINLVISSGSSHGNDHQSHLVVAIIANGLWAAISIAAAEHVLLALYYLPRARQVVLERNTRENNTNNAVSWLHVLFVALGAGSVVSAQEVTRLVASVYRLAPFSSMCRRVDWNDGQQPKFILDGQLRSVLQFALYSLIAYYWMSSLLLLNTSTPSNHHAGSYCDATAV